MNTLPQVELAHTDAFWAKQYGRKVRSFFFDADGNRYATPIATPEHVEYWAHLAGSYARRALAHQIEVERGWMAVRVLLGEVR